MEDSRPRTRPVPRRLARSIWRARLRSGLFLVVLLGVMVWSWGASDPIRKAAFDGTAPLMFAVVLLDGPEARRRTLLRARCAPASGRRVRASGADPAAIAAGARAYRNIGLLWLVVVAITLCIRREETPLRDALFGLAAALLLFGIWRTVNELRALGDARRGGARRRHLRRVFG